jgi:hypothetical protein
MMATLPEDCPRSGPTSVALAVAPDDSGTPPAPGVLPIGVPALLSTFDAPATARFTGLSTALDRRPVDTTLRI